MPQLPPHPRTRLGGARRWAGVGSAAPRTSPAPRHRQEGEGVLKPHLQLRPSPGARCLALARAVRKRQGKKKKKKPKEPRGQPATDRKLEVPPDFRAAATAVVSPSSRLLLLLLLLPPGSRHHRQYCRHHYRRRRRRHSLSTARAPADVTAPRPLSETPSPAPGPAARHCELRLLPARPPRFPAPSGERDSASRRPLAPSRERRVMG